MSKVDQKQTI